MGNTALNVTNRPGSTLTVFHSDGRTDRIKVRYNPQAMHSMGVMLACAISVTEILVDDIFVKLVKAGMRNVCMGLLSHEIGHIMNGDLSYMEYARKHGRFPEDIIHSMDIIQEYNADIYASGINKENTLAMLRYLYEIHSMAGADTASITDRYSMVAGIQ